MWASPQFPADLVTFTEKILNGKLHCFVQWLFYVSKLFEIQIDGFFCYNISLNVLRSKFPKSGKIGFPVESSIVDLFEFCSELNLCEGRLDTRLCLQLIERLSKFSHFPIIIVLKSFENSWGNSHIQFLVIIIYFYLTCAEGKVY